MSSYGLLSTEEDHPNRCEQRFRNALSNSGPWRHLESFEWNGRSCTGSSFHVNVRNNNELEVMRQLEEDPDKVNETFGYETVWRGMQQLCTAKAIHMAAGRGHQKMVEILLDRRASLDSAVTRDGRKNYEVIHAAVFAEGRGGTSEMINFLCDRGADIESLNANKWSCLHVAFQTGNMATIKAVRRTRALKLGKGEECDDVEEEAQNEVETPLELGIREGKMNTEHLAEAAPANLRSLQSFSRRAPECIPMFLERLSHSDMKKMAHQLTHMDLARLVQRYPESAKMLLDKATVKAEAADAEWHPLPQRVSFSRGYGSDVVQSIYLYEVDNHWVFDGCLLNSPTWPSWHSKIIYKDSGLDASIRVCHVPNIISPNVFAALVGSARHGDSALCLYESSALRAAVSYAFKSGAMWFELLQCLISLWGLSLLVLQTCFNHEKEVGLGAESLHIRMDAGVFDPSIATKSHKAGVVADWMIAKGVVDLCLEVAEVCGRIRAGELHGYMSFGNAWDLLRSLTPIALLVFHSRRLLHLLVVLIYWMRLFESVILSEWVGCQLLPLQKLLVGLMPAVAFTVVCFAALTHAMYTVQVTADHLWPKTVFHTFTRLIAQGLPNHAPEDGLELLVLYGGVVFFSIFVLNIFIGVIDEEYKNEKQLSHLKFLGLRASSCLTYLLRMRVVPCNLLSSKAAFRVAVMGVLAGLGLQVHAVLGSPAFQLPGVVQLQAFMACQFMIFLCPFQCNGDQDNGPWTDSFELSGEAFRRAPGCCTPLSPGEAVRRYIWIIEPRDQQDRDVRGHCTPRAPKLETAMASEPGQLLDRLKEAIQKFDDAKDQILASTLASRIQSSAASAQGPNSPASRTPRTLLTSKPSYETRSKAYAECS